MIHIKVKESTVVMSAIKEITESDLKRAAPSSGEPSSKRQRPVFKDETLENQLFDWTDWDPTDQADMVFYGIKMKIRLVGVPEDDQIVCAEWYASKSKVVFNFKDGSKRTFGLKVSLTMY